jgi:hypothetical protein
VGSHSAHHRLKSKGGRFPGVSHRSVARPAIFVDRHERCWIFLETGPGRIRTYDQGIHSAPEFPPGVDYLITRMIARSCEGAGGSCLSSRALQPSGSLCTFRRCTAGSAQGCHERSLEGFPEFFPFASRVTARRHRFDESPALTAVLQAQRGELYQSGRISHSPGWWAGALRPRRRRSHRGQGTAALPVPGGTL